MEAVVERYGEVLDALSDGLLLLSVDGAVLLFNSSALRLLPELQINQPLQQSYPAFAAELAPHLLVALGGKTVTVERLFLRRADAAYYLHVQLYAVGPGPGGQPNILVTLRDVTEAALDDSHRASNFSEIESQLKIARRYQEALFTNRWEDSALSCQAFGRPAFELSGDFFEVGRVGDRYLIVVGDVQSHGIEVAIKAITLQHLCRLNVGTSADPARLMRELNDFVFSDQQGEFWSCCVFIACYDPDSRVLQYSRAGIPEPILFRGHGEVELLEVGDTPLGFFENEQYRSGSVRIRAGDRLVLHSDGVTDAYPLDAPYQYYGQDRLVRDFKALAQGAGNEHRCLDLVRLVEAFHGAGSYADDFTLAEVLFR